MGNVRFISDLHLGHRNMAIRRGFKDEDEHDEYIIKKWNSVVNKKDVTYVLGDFTMERDDYEKLNQLKGIKKALLGNHDKPQHVSSLLKYVNNVSGIVYYKKKYILTHCPVHTDELKYRATYNIHGHVHENTIPDARYINVSAEVIDYTPKLLKELIPPK